MSGNENLDKFRPRFLLNALAAWFVAALLLLLLFSLIVSRTATSSQSMAYFSSALSFLSAAAAGAAGARKRKSHVLLSGILCGLLLVAILLLVGFLINRKSMTSDAVLSLVTFSLAGALVGSVFLSGSLRKRNSKKHAFPTRKAGARKS